MLHASDQAAGLRRLFRRAPSAVVALFTSGRAPRQLAVRTLMDTTFCFYDLNLLTLTKHP